MISNKSIPEVNTVPIFDTLKDDVYWLTLECPQIVKKYLRNYMKVQELFAKVGGLINAMMITVNLATLHFLKFEYYKHCRKNMELNNLSYLKNKEIVIYEQSMANFIDLIESNNFKAKYNSPNN